MAERRFRILLVTRNLPPLVGGMERLNWHMAQELAEAAEVRVIAPEGSADLAPAGVTVIEVPLRPLWRFLLVALWRSILQARGWQPDLVLAGSGLAALPVWFAARASGAKAVTYVHGLDVAVNHVLYRTLWLPALCRMDRVIANSSPTSALARRAGVSARRIELLYPGVAQPQSSPSLRSKAELRAELQLGTGPILLSVGRLTTRKGIKEFVRDVLPRIVEVYPDASLVVVGDAPTQSLLAEPQSPESILDAASQIGVSKSIRFVGTITDYARLGMFYMSADVHVFPVRELAGDPEGFGMVAVEAAAHGLATAAYASGGVVDSVAVGISGLLAPPGDAAAMIRNILELIEHPLPQAPMQAFAAEFAWPRFGERLRAMLVHELDPERQEP